MCSLYVILYEYSIFWESIPKWIISQIPRCWDSKVDSVFITLICKHISEEPYTMEPLRHRDGEKNLIQVLHSSRNFVFSCRSMKNSFCFHLTLFPSQKFCKRIQSFSWECKSTKALNHNVIKTFMWKENK